MQSGPQSISPGPHVAAHWPPLQNSPCRQGSPQPPQFEASLSVSTQTSLQLVEPRPQQMPARQFSPVTQTSEPAVPAQPPQLARSVSVFVQLVPLHEMLLAPVQQKPSLQMPAQAAAPHAPQLLTSMSVFVQVVPLHETSGSVQQTPIVHV